MHVSFKYSPPAFAHWHKKLISRRLVCELASGSQMVHLCSMQWVIKDGKVTAVDWGFNVYGGIQKENGDWYSKWGALYATDLKDARCCKLCF